MSRKELERLWIAGAAVVGLLLVLIGYFGFIGPQRSQTRDINAQVNAATAANSSLSDTITNLSMQSRDLPKYEAELTQARLALPSTSGLSDFLRTLQTIGTTTNTDTSLSVNAPTDVTALATGTSTTVAPATATSSSAPAAPTVNGAHVYALPITAQVKGNVADLNAFLTQLQSVQPRAVLISQITETTGANASTGAVTSAPGLTLTMQAFVAPSDPTESANLAAEAGQH